jgi:hypothetical protein
MLSGRTNLRFRAEPLPCQLEGSRVGDDIAEVRRTELRIPIERRGDPEDALAGFSDRVACVVCATQGVKGLCAGQVQERAG